MPEQRYYMACLDLEGLSVLVVGGGRIAKEKVAGLLECGADVTVVAPRIRDDVRALPVTWLPRAYEEADLDRRYLVVAATEIESLNAEVARDAAARSLLCNVVDDEHAAALEVEAGHVVPLLGHLRHPPSARGRPTGRAESSAPSRRRRARGRRRRGRGR